MYVLKFILIKSIQINVLTLHLLCSLLMLAFLNKHDKHDSVEPYWFCIVPHSRVCIDFLISFIYCHLMLNLCSANCSQAYSGLGKFPILACSERCITTKLVYLRGSMIGSDISISLYEILTLILILILILYIILL